jgi:protein gp37
MAENSNIEWTDHTFNPWIGCTKVSPGCANCYAEMLMDTRYGRVKWGKGQPRVRTSEANWKLPLKWDREAAIAQLEWRALVKHFSDGPADAVARGFPRPSRPRVFCASLADWLDEEVTVEWLADLLDLIHRTPNLDWLLLTKRPQNWRSLMEKAMRYAMMASPITDDKDREKDRLSRHGLACWIRDWLQGTPPGNVWIGTTVEDQQRADERIPTLASIPARVRFLSCEPLLSVVDLSRHLFSVPGARLNWIHWVICGGESGPGARPMLIEWADDLRRQCKQAGVPFFMKQLGANVGTTNANAHDWPEDVRFEEVAGTPQFAGARVLLSDKKGGCLEDFPSELQVRQFPT